MDSVIDTQDRSLIKRGEESETQFQIGLLKIIPVLGTVLFCMHKSENDLKNTAQNQ